MELNYDCVRDLLLTLETELQFNENLEYPDINLNQLCNLMSDYNKQEIAYTSLKLIEADYICANPLSVDDSIYDILYSSITFAGHQYLDSVRDTNVWKKIKKGSKGFTFDLIKKLAEKYILESFIP